MRLIDADRFLRETRFQEGVYPQKTLRREIGEQPTVDAVPVVRCRECKYSYGNKYCTNDAWKDEGNTVYIEPDAFCSYGERRNDG